MSRRSKERRRAAQKMQWKRNKKQEILPARDNTISREELSDYKRAMQKIVDYTNARIDEAVESRTASTELFSFFDGDEKRRFDISQLTDPADIKEYMTEVRVVLSTIGEGSNKAQVDSAIMEAEVYRNQFGNQHRSAFIDEGKVHVRHYNMNDVFDEDGNIIRRAINPETASKAFSAYRRLEETYAGYIGREGQELMFGSESLIILLYDFYEKNPGADYDFNSDGSTEDAVNYASPLLDAWINEKVLELEGLNYSFNQASDIITSWEDRLNRRYF